MFATADLPEGLAYTCNTVNGVKTKQVLLCGEGTPAAEVVLFTQECEGCRP